MKNLFPRLVYRVGLNKSRRWWLVLLCLLMLLGGLLWLARAPQTGVAAQGSADAVRLSEGVQRQIKALLDEKAARTPAQQKLDSQLLYALKMRRGEEVAPGIRQLSVRVETDAKARTVVDITAIVGGTLLEDIEAIGAEIISVHAQYHSIRASTPFDRLEEIAALPQVRFIQPKQEPQYLRHVARERERGVAIGEELPPGFLSRANRVRGFLTEALDHLPLQQQLGIRQINNATFAGGKTSEGDVTHRAAAARAMFGANGAGVRIGVLSDGVVSLAASQASGDLPTNLVVLPASGPVAGDEGTAMLEIINDLAPGAQLYFAGALGNAASFAQAIRDLRAAGCDIIVDDIQYDAETPFQDGQAPGVISTTNGGVIAQAVNDVTASGALYFTSAGNQGNKDKNTSGVWVGDFVDGGALPLIPGSTVHNFGSGMQFDMITAISNRPVATLFWSDPLGGSNNDYDLFVLNNTGSGIVASSTNLQNGTQDPFELLNTGIATNNRLVILKKTGAANRFLYLQNYRGRLNISTEGQVHGHGCGANAFSVAATPAGTAFGAAPNPTGPFPNPFNSSNIVELFSSDGPRRLFFNANGTPITPGNFSSTGGLLRQKPDITAADGVMVTGAGGFGTTIGGNKFFFGTSAAAPHAAAIAALLKSANPALTPAQIRNALINTAVDIEGAGVDRNSGAGVIMAFQALQAIGAVPSPNLQIGTVTATPVGGNFNTLIEPGESAQLNVQLLNTGVSDASNIAVTLTTTTPGVTISQGNANYPNLAFASGAAVNPTPFTFALSPGAMCPLRVEFVLNVNFAGGGSPRALKFSVPTGPPPVVITSRLDATAPAPGPGFTATSGLQLARLNRSGLFSLCGVNAPCPGVLAGGTGTRRYDAYSFSTCPASTPACITVTLETPCRTAANAIFATAYLGNSFSPGSLCTNYLADMGFDSSGASPASFSFNVPSGASFTIIVNEVNDGGGLNCNYSLNVTGLCCQQTSLCPAFTNVNPASSGPGTNVTITGTNFTGVTGVRFANDAAAAFTVNSDSQITAIVPSGAGNGPLTISRPGCPDVQTPAFTLLACPTITTFSPIFGTVGATVVITGTNFTGTSAVKFANNVPASFTINSDTQITATVPAGAVTGPITLSWLGCNDAQTTAFTVQPGACTGAAVELKVDDGSFESGIGQTNGGTDNGVNRLTPASYPATLNGISIFWPNGVGLQVGASLTLLIGNNSSGGTNINGLSFQTVTATVQTLGQFNFYSVPPLTINAGDFVVGFRMTHGANVFPIALDLTAPSQRRSYFSADGNTFTIIDDLNASLAGDFGIRAELQGTTATCCPVVSGLNPTTGGTGTQVTITGANFTGVTAVKFANNVTANFTVVNDTTITTTVPSGAVNAPITISRPSCPDAQTAPFTLPIVCPTVSGFSPTSGTGSTLVTINGTGFTGVTSVTFNTFNANFTVNSDTQITATAPTPAFNGPIRIRKTGCAEVVAGNFIACGAINIAAASLPDGAGGTIYNQTLTASGGTAPYSFAVTSGALPSGLTLTNGGILSGTPNVAGTFNFTLTATDANGCASTRNYTVNITITLDAQTRALYVLNENRSGNQIYGYAVNEMTGALTLLPGFPISTGGIGFGDFPSERLVIDRANLRLYAINSFTSSSTVSAYAINPLTGALTQLPFSPIRLGFGDWYTSSIHPSGSPLVVGDGTNHRLLSYQITATTATAAIGSPYNTGNAAPRSTTFSQDGRYVYTGGPLTTTIASFSVDPATGTLTELSTSFDSGASSPLAYATDAVGRLFVAHFGDAQVRVFTTASGIPSSVPGNPFVSGLSQASHGLLHPNGFYLVAASIGRVGVYQINGNGSATTLTAVSGSPFVTGGTMPNVLSLNQAGTFLFAANGFSRNLTTFSVNLTTGALTTLSTQPTNTLGISGSITGMVYLPSQCPTITLSPATLLSGSVGTAYNQTITASPSGNYTFAVSAGALPAGLSLNATTGAITGMPTTAGVASFTITAISSGGCSRSQNYTLTIGQSNRMVRVGNASGNSGSIVSVPVELLALGNENALSFSLNFNPAILSNPQVTLGSDASLAQLNVNSFQAAQGRLGILLTLPPMQTFPSGIRQVVVVTFSIAASAPAGLTPVSFGDQPAERKVIDDMGTILPPPPYTQGAINVISNPVPMLGSLNPGSVLAGSPGFALTVNGTGFVNGSTVRWNGADRATTFVSAMQLTAQIPTTDLATAGTASVSVFNPTPGGGTSNAATFTINNPLPALLSLNPSSATAGGQGFSLTVNGSNFVNGSVVQWNGSNRATTFVNATQLTAAISAADIATTGTATVTVANSAPGGGTSNALNFIINNPTPTLANINPSSAIVGGAAFTLTLTGTNFISNSVVQWNGSNRPTTFVSSTQLTAAIPASDIASAGMANVTVVNPAPGGGTSTARTFTINNPVPLLTSLNPSFAVMGSAGFTLTITGNGFVPNAVVRWNGADRPTTFNNGTQLTAAIPASDLVAAGAASVAVFNPTPGGGLSTALTFTIFFPVPTITDLNPRSAIAGSGVFTLTVSGTGFLPGAVVQWFGASRPTTFISSTQLTAQIPASDIAAAGSAMITVTNPAPGNTTSNAEVFTINNPVPTITSLNPSSAVAGGPAFTLTVTGTNFVPQSSARWNGLPRLTTFISSTQLTVAISAADIILVGTNTVTVSNPAPGGGTSAAQTFTVNSLAPTLASLNPSSVIAGGAAFMLTVNGLNFVNGSVVRWNDSNRATTFFSSTRLTADISAADIASAGTARVTVVNPAPGGGTSNELTVTIANTVTSVSAASFLGAELATESIVSAFGPGLTTSTAIADTTPLPTTLAGTTVKVRDSAGVERLAPLFFVAPLQINYLMPPGTAAGTAAITVTSGNGTLSVGTMQIAPVAPGLFTANASGQGVPAAVVFRLKANGAQSTEPVAQFDVATGRFVATPIELGPEGEQVFLILFGTGFRAVSSLNNVTARLGGTNAEVLFAGAQGLAGLDQANLRIPRSLAGRGEVDVVITVDGKMANTVRINVK